MTQFNNSTTYENNYGHYDHKYYPFSNNELANIFLITHMNHSNYGTYLPHANKIRECGDNIPRYYRKHGSLSGIQIHGKNKWLIGNLEKILEKRSGMHTQKQEKQLHPVHIKENNFTKFI